MSADLVSVLVALAVVVALLVTLVNLAVLGLALKLYTEVFKELAQRRRSEAKP